MLLSQNGLGVMVDMFGRVLLIFVLDGGIHKLICMLAVLERCSRSVRRRLELKEDLKNGGIIRWIMEL